MIERQLVRLSLVVILLAVSFGAFSLMQTSPAQAAETLVPIYGCPATLDGSPIGGGEGCTTLYTAAGADYVATTAAQLKTDLAAAAPGEIVYVADGATLTITKAAGSTHYSDTQLVYVPAGVILAGGRGNVDVTAGIIKIDSGWTTTAERTCIFLAGDDSNVCGLTIVGVQEGTGPGDYCTGIESRYDNEIYNNEIHGFGYAGVFVNGSNVSMGTANVWIHHNYIHHCQQTDDPVGGLGYGVSIWADGLDHNCYALVEGNLFDYCRHVISGGMGRDSWVFRYNYLGAHCVGQQVDAHGQNDDQTKVGGVYKYPAGENIEVYNNTLTAPIIPVRIRGFSYAGGSISIHNNWITAVNEDDVDSGSGHYFGMICQQMYDIPEYQYTAPAEGLLTEYGEDEGPFVQMESYDNWWGTTPPPSTNRAPVLDAVGNKAVVELATLAFTISATDPDGDTLTYSASNLPQGASFDPSTRTFSWTPADSQAGVYANIRFRVSDGALSDTEDITITVNDVVQADVNSDGAVNSLDMIRVGQHWNETGVSGWIPEDINKDGTVNVLDATLIGQHWTG